MKPADEGYAEAKDGLNALVSELEVVGICRGYAGMIDGAFVDLDKQYRGRVVLAGPIRGAVEAARQGAVEDVRD